RAGGQLRRIYESSNDGVWEDPDLSKRDCSLITVVALVCMGRMDEFPSHLHSAISTAAITHLAFYAGFPAANPPRQLPTAFYDHLLLQSSPQLADILWLHCRRGISPRVADVGQDVCNLRVIEIPAEGGHGGRGRRS